MIFSGLMIPFLGTTLGAGMVFFMKGSMNQKLEKMLLGFAAGVIRSAVPQYPLPLFLLLLYQFP